jgi:GT2 family glycosyltransferase
LPDSRAVDSGVAVVIATVGRADALEGCLDSLALQSHRPAEIIVVHSGGDTDTRALCERDWSSRGLKVEYQPYPQKSAALQRDFAVRRTAQPLILFSDDDVEFEADFIERLLDVLSRDASIGAVMGRVDNHFLGRPTLLWRFYRRLVVGSHRATLPGAVVGAMLHNGFPSDPRDPVRAEWLGGGTTLLRKTAYLSVNGFAPYFRGSSPGEDIDLGYRISRKWQILYVPQARCLHHQSPAGREGIGRYQFLTVRSRYAFCRASAGMNAVLSWAHLAVWATFQTASELGQLRRGRLPAGFWSAVGGRLRGVWSCVGWDPAAEQFPEWHDTHVA